MRLARLRVAGGAVSFSIVLALAGCGDGGQDTSTPTTEAPTANTEITDSTLPPTPVVRSANLSGAAEAPAPGDVDGSGRAKITLDSTKGEVCFDLQVANVEKPTGAHIHKAPPGMAGNIVVSLAPPSEGTAKGCVPADKGLVADIAANPAAYYVNVHNGPYEKGAVRGQLSK